MSYKSLLAYLAENERSKAVSATALTLAAAFDAHLTALHLYVPSDAAYAAYAEFPVWGGVKALQREQARAQEYDASLKADFEAQAAQFSPLQTEWRFSSGDVAETLALHARYADLVLLGQYAPEDKTNRSGFDTPAEVAVLSGRPVLVLPDDNPVDVDGKRVLVAWNASREATRAAGAALPLLKRAQSVDVVIVEGNDDDYGDEPGADIALFLARHGVNASVSRVPQGELRVSEVLLSVAAEHGSDLLCMGAYGHSRLRELAFGGVTYEIMRRMTVPTLIAG